MALSGCGDDTSSGGGAGGGPAGSGTITVQISGEDAATDGFLFPDGSEVTISDGWELRFDHVFVTVGEVWLAENPDKAPSDQSQTGTVVARKAGPWAVDLAIPGTVAGAGGEGTAVPLVDFDTMTEQGDAPFAADQRYAFSYSFVAAASGATKVNFADDPDTASAYDDVAADGCVVAYLGTATFKGTACESSDPAYDFTAIPTSVPFRLCFKTPTHYENCQNEENQGDPFPDEEFQRGIPIKANEASTAQITVHLEHPFYSDVQHEPRLFFDQYAATLVGQPEGTTLELDALAALDPTGFRDGADASLPWRVCDGGALPTGQRAFSAGSIPVGPGQDPSQGFRNYLDYVGYVQSTQGHLNGGEGLCYINRQFPSPQ